MEFKAQAYYRQQHADEPAVICSPEDVDALIDSLVFGAEFESMAVLQSLQRETLPSGFPDHEFLVGVNRERQVGVVSLIDDRSHVSTSPSEFRSGEVIYHIAGTPTEFPVAAEIPLPLVREAVKEFLLSGGQRPTCVEWQEDSA